jgi:hypothetical protein
MITTLLFFAVFGVLSGFVENSMREDNILNGIRDPLPHKKLLAYRVSVGGTFLAFVGVFELLFGNIGWTYLLYIPIAMAVFGIFHRITINYAAGNGPWYLGIDSKVDQFMLRLVGVDYIYDSSAYHFEAWVELPNYRRKVKQAALLLYTAELAVILLSAYIIL